MEVSLCCDFAVLMKPDVNRVGGKTGTSLFILITLQAPRAGKTNQIPRCDWLLERARWSDTARSGLPVLFPQQHFAKVQAGARKFSFTKYFP